MSTIRSGERSQVESRYPAILLIPLFLALFLDDVVAQGLPVETGSQVPVWIWFFGTCVLGVVIAYSTFRYRSRSRADKEITERATEKLYAEEERDRKQSTGI